ncbi:unnamed protein product, partial [Larinioides sclopetarius]
LHHVHIPITLYPANKTVGKKTIPRVIFHAKNKWLIDGSFKQWGEIPQPEVRFPYTRYICRFSYWQDNIIHQTVSILRSRWWYWFSQESLE